MLYTINDVKKIYDISTSTLRFYEKEGLLPKINRDSSGRRVYEEKELEWLQLVIALKDTGMTLETIKEYIEMANEGEKTLEQRRKILLEHKQSVEKKLTLTLEHLEKINRKITVYDVLVLKKNPKDLLFNDFS